VVNSNQFRTNLSSIGDSRAYREKRLAGIFSENYRLFVILASQHLYKRIRREAEDVVQDAFLSAFEQLDRYRGEATLKTWVSVIILRTAWRRNKNQEPVLGIYEQIESTDLADPLSLYQKFETYDTLEKLIAHLSDEQREFLDRWRADEFKGQMELSKNRNNLSRSKERMRFIAREIGVLEDAA
jgi:RNA polymerase sigma factor (sigma-70 family)